MNSPIRTLLARVLPIAVLVGLSAPAWADYDAALRAWEAEDWEAARSACIQEAGAGDPACQRMLGVLSYFGRGMPQDYAKAAAWIRQAADQGFARAQSEYGWLLAQGHGVPQDKRAAAAWYRLAAEAGYAEAQYHLSQAYWLGEGVEADLLEAERLARSAAEQGEAGAQFFLGTIYWDGVQDVIPRDRPQGRAWMEAAAAQGHAEAQAQLDDEPWLLVKLVILGIIAGAVLVWNGWRTAGALRNARASHGWPVVAGRVRSSKLGTVRVRWSTFYRPEVVYEYTVGDCSYAGDAIRFGGFPPSPRDAARRELAKYPVGGLVTVIHDPARPERAALERRSTIMMPLTITVCSGLIFLVALGVFLDEWGAYATSG